MKHLITKQRGGENLSQERIEKISACLISLGYVVRVKRVPYGKTTKQAIEYYSIEEMGEEK